MRKSRISTFAIHFESVQKFAKSYFATTCGTTNLFFYRTSNDVTVWSFVHRKKADWNSMNFPHRHCSTLGSSILEQLFVLFLTTHQICDLVVRNRRCSGNDLRTSHSITRKHPNVEMLDDRIVTALKEHLGLWRQGAYMIYEQALREVSSETTLEFSDLVRVTLRRDAVHGFEAQWYEVPFSWMETPKDDTHWKACTDTTQIFGTIEDHTCSVQSRYGTEGWTNSRIGWKEVLRSGNVGSKISMLGTTRTANCSSRQTENREQKPKKSTKIPKIDNG